MATSEQLLTALCTALRGATLPNSTTWLHPSPSLREIADGRDDILAEAAGLSAGCWYAWPSTHVGYGGSNGKPLDYDELERWTRVGYERGMRSPKGER